jgi:TBC1 domain family member 8/9
MKRLKPFVPSLYSEYLLTAPITSSSATAGGGGGDQSGRSVDLINLGSTSARPPDSPTSPSTSVNVQQVGEGDARGPGGVGKGRYERGLGEEFGYPGDARKLRERSKIKLWKEYFIGEFGLGRRGGGG